MIISSLLIVLTASCGDDGGGGGDRGGSGGDNARTPNLQQRCRRAEFFNGDWWYNNKRLNCERFRDKAWYQERYHDQYHFNNPAGLGDFPVVRHPDKCQFHRWNYPLFMPRQRRFYCVSRNYLISLGLHIQGGVRYYVFPDPWIMGRLRRYSHYDRGERFQAQCGLLGAALGGVGGYYAVDQSALGAVLGTLFGGVAGNVVCSSDLWGSSDEEEDWTIDHGFGDEDHSFGGGSFEFY